MIFLVKNAVLNIFPFLEISEENMLFILEFRKTTPHIGKTVIIFRKSYFFLGNLNSKSFFKQPYDFILVKWFYLAFSVSQWISKVFVRNSELSNI